jgi:Fe-S-cluster containining protein
MECQTFSHYDNDVEILKYKEQYKSLDDAKRACKWLNSSEEQIYALVPYQCSICNFYHIGTGDKPLPRK